MPGTATVVTAAITIAGLVPEIPRKKGNLIKRDQPCLRPSDQSFGLICRTTDSSLPPPSLQSTVTVKLLSNILPSLTATAQPLFRQTLNKGLERGLLNQSLMKKTEVAVSALASLLVVLTAYLM